MSSTLVPGTSQLRAIETADQREQVLCLYRRKTLRRGRLDIIRRVPPLSGHNLQLTNAAGSTWFMPICDVSSSLIALIAQFVGQRLERFVAKSSKG